MPEIPVEALTGCLGGLRKAVLAVPAVRTAQWTKFKPVRQVSLSIGYPQAAEIFYSPPSSCTSLRLNVRVV